MEKTKRKQKSDSENVRDIGVLYLQSSAHMKQRPEKPKKEKKVHKQRAKAIKKTNGQIPRGDYNPNRWEDFQYDQMKQKEIELAERLKEIDKTGSSAQEMAKAYIKEEHKPKAEPKSSSYKIKGSEYKVKDEKGNDVVFETVVPKSEADAYAKKEEKTFDYGPSEEELKKRQEEMQKDMEDTAKRNRKILSPHTKEKMEKEPNFDYYKNMANLFQNAFNSEALNSTKKKAEDFDIRFPSVEDFKRFVELATKGNGNKRETDLVFVIDKKGLHSSKISSGAISMGIFSYPHQYLDKYEVKEPGYVSLNTDQLINQLKNTKEGSVELKSQADGVEIKIENRGNVEYTSKMPNFDVNESSRYLKSVPLNGEKYKNVIRIDTPKQLKKDLKEIADVSDYGSLEIKDNNLILHAKNREDAEKTKVIPINVAKHEETNITKFNLEFLMTGIKYASDDQPIYLGWTYGEPLGIEYTSKVKDVKADFFLAPYMEE